MEFSHRFEEAFLMANRLHAGQHRKKSPLPYIVHLMGVAVLVAEYGGDEDQVIAAFLHDAVEDQGGAATREQIRRRFGDRVTRMVDDCTDTDKTPKPPWKPRKQAYIDHLEHEAAEDSLLVSAADKLYNVRTIIAGLREHGDQFFDRFSAKKEGTLWYYRELVECFTRRGPQPIAEHLSRAVDQLERLATQRDM